MKRITLFILAITSLASLPSCEAIAKKTGMSPVDLFSITSGAALRLQAEADRLKAEIKAAQEAEAARSAKQHINVQPN